MSEINACNPGQNIFELYNVLVQVQFATKKANHIQYNKLGLRVAERVVERVFERLEKSQIRVETT